MGSADLSSSILSILQDQGRTDEILDPSDVRLCQRCSEIFSTIEQLSAQDSTYHRHLIPRAVFPTVSEIKSFSPRECILCYRIQDYVRGALDAGREVFVLLNIHQNEHKACCHGGISFCHGDPWYLSGDDQYKSTGCEFEMHVEKEHLCTAECTTSRDKYSTGDILHDPCGCKNISLDHKMMGTMEEHLARMTVSTSSTATMALLEKWTNTCQAEHSNCKYSVNFIERPTRILDVGSGKSDTVYLVNGADTEGHWAVLSYCWGLTKFVKLTTTNYSTMVAGVATEKLPKTFQDAVLVCHALGIRYLWIDALCIIQGPDGDFRTEAGRMASVYSGSYVSIAAAWGKDTSSGLFSQRHVDARHSVIHGDGKTFTVLSSPLRAGLSSPSISHLRTRGWVLQESLLAPRTVFFAVGGVWFECRSALRTDFTSIMGLDTWAAQGLQKLRAREKSLYKGSEKSLYELFIARGDQDMNSSAAYTAWWSIVGDFCKMSLTHKSDKLAAMAGAAALLATNLSDKRCSFGMWMQWLPGDLLFSRKVLTVDKVPQICQTYDDRGSPANKMFPSWSWASYDGDSFTTPDIEANSHGYDRKFYTTARARIVKYPPETSFTADALAQKLQEEPASIVIETVAFVCTAPHATHKDGTGMLYTAVCRQDAKQSHSENLFIQLDSPELAPVYDKSDPWICALVRRTYEDSWRHDEGLVLRPCRQHRGKYRRVGYFDTGGGWKEDRLAEDIKKEKELGAEIGLKVAISDDGFFRPGDGFRLVEII